MKRKIRPLITALGILLLTGCSHIPSFSDSSQRAPIRKAIVQKDIVPKPYMMKDEYCVPHASARQIFSWGGFGQDWTLKVKNSNFDYAGFYLRKPLNLTERRDDTHLNFKLRPAAVANELSMILLEGKGQARGPRAVNLVAYQTDLNEKGWGTYTIPLNEFICGTGPVPCQQQAFNWGDVQEIRILRNVPELNHKKIQIRNLRLRSASFADPSRL